MIPAALLGNASFDVNDVDLSSLLLEGVPPLRSNLEDVAGAVAARDACTCTTEAPDRIGDLTLKFDAQALVAALGPVANREERPVTLTGQLLDGTPFEVSDCVLILVPPGVPANLRTSGPVSGQVTLTWDDTTSPDFLYFAVYRGEEPGFLPASVLDYIATTTEPRFIDQFEAGASRYYRIAAFARPAVVETLEGEVVFDIASDYSEAVGPAVVTDMGTVGSPGLSLAGSPTPFRSATQVVYTLPEESPVRLLVFDAVGQRVATLVDGVQDAGVHSVPWDAIGFASGTYFYRLEARGEVLTKRVLLIR